MKQTLAYLFQHQYLSREAAEEVLIKISRGMYSHAEIASFLTVFQMRSISVEELIGFRNALLRLCTPVDLTAYEPIDLCGTGGDGKDTFNISTLASFVVAGAGVPVAKHGNYSVSSTCGSSDVMQYLGYRFSDSTDKLEQEIEATNICFLHAPLFHPAMKAVAPVRKHLGVKTFFNMLGPMVNPAQPNHQVVGVFSLGLARLYQYIYQQTNRSYYIVHGLDGYDEVSLTGTTKLIQADGESLLTPSMLGLSKHPASALFGGTTIETAAKLFIQILEGGGTKAQEEVVLANAALALHVAGVEDSLRASVEVARASLKGGDALKVFKKLMALQD